MDVTLEVLIDSDSPNFYFKIQINSNSKSDPKKLNFSNFYFLREIFYHHFVLIFKLIGWHL